MDRPSSELSPVGDILGGLQLPTAVPDPPKVKPVKPGRAPGDISKSDICYTHPLFMQTYLPLRRKRGADQLWQTKNGRASLLIRAGMLIDPGNPHKFIQASVPAGGKGRLVIDYVNDYIYRNKTPRVPLGDSLRQGMVKLGIPIGGKNGEALRREIDNFFSSDFYFGGWDRGGATLDKARVGSHMSFWNDRDGKQATLWQSEMQVSDEYYATLMAQGMAPVYWPARIALQHCPLAMDIHSLLVYRLRKPLPRPLELSREDLYQLLGGGTGLLKNFWVQFKLALPQAHKWYQEARIQLKEGGGLVLRTSEPLIPHQKSLRLN